MLPLRIFLGFDQREAVGSHVFVQSLREQARVPVEMQFVGGEQRDGTNAFTYERFSIPERCLWWGWALYVDAADMLLRACPSELWELRNPKFAVQVVKHDYRTKHPRKYVGTAMESGNQDYPRKNWSSVVLWNCGHTAHSQRRHDMRNGNGAFLHRFAWLKDEEIGELPREWNWLDEYGENTQAKLVHWTTGIPGFSAYRQAPHAGEWHATLERALGGLQTHSISER